MKYEFDICDLEIAIKDYLYGTSKENISCFFEDLRGFLKEYEVQEPLKIEIDTFYKNRNGDKCFVYNYDIHNRKYLYVASSKNYDCFSNVYANGMYLAGEKCRDDLISEWTDEDELEWRDKNGK